MNYYYDFEFLEGKQDKRFLGIKYGQTKPTIDLISIGIVDEEGKEYYAISKDFNLKEAWNRYDTKIEQMYGDARNIWPEGKKTKVYWIRENVILPIAYELAHKDYKEKGDFMLQFDNISDWIKLIKKGSNWEKTWYKRTKELVKKYGKTNKQISEEVFEFITKDPITIKKAKHYNIEYRNINLYGYYSAYDHVCFSWLFGKMIDLPNGFPMYTKDLQQIFDEKQNLNDEQRRLQFNNLSDLKLHPNYPKNKNEHSALQDARWNKKLHEFLKTI